MFWVVLWLVGSVLIIGFAILYWFLFRLATFCWFVSGFCCGLVVPFWVSHCGLVPFWVCYCCLVPFWDCHLLLVPVWVCHLFVLFRFVCFVGSFVGFGVVLGACSGLWVPF